MLYLLIPKFSKKVNFSGSLIFKHVKAFFPGNHIVSQPSVIDLVVEEEPEIVVNQVDYLDDDAVPLEAEQAELPQFGT